MQRILKILVIACILFAGFFTLNYVQDHLSKQAYVSITFDDGYLSQYKAAELLERYGYRGTFYIPADLVGKEFEGKQLMSWPELETLQNRGHEIGAHTFSHVNSSVPEDIYNAGVLLGKEILQEHGFSTKDFAYPYGDDTYKQAGKYFVTARNTKWCTNKISDRELCGITLTDSLGNQTVLQFYLSQLKTKGGWLVIVIHSVDENPRTDVDITVEQLFYILDQIRNSGIEVKTIAEVANGV